MKRRAIRCALLALLGAVVLTPTGAPLRADDTPRHVLRVATLAPRDTPLVRTFQRWDRMLRKKTGGEVGLRVYPGGTAGSEQLLVRKMRTGQLDAAALSVTGLGLIAKEALVLATPGAVRTYGQLDAVRDALAPELERMFAEQGFRLIGWGDLGEVRLFSTERIQRPRDLRSVRPWVPQENPVLVEWMDQLGVNGVKLKAPEVYPALQTGMVDTVLASALSVVAMQWFTRLDYVSRESSGFIVGAFVARKDAFDALPEKARRLLRRTARRADGQRWAVRDLDDRAYEELVRNHGMTAVSMAPYGCEWERASRKTREALAGRLYPEKLLQRVRDVARKN